MPLSIRPCTNLMMSGMVWVTLGCTVAGVTFSCFTSSKYAAMYFSPTSRAEIPSSLARFMILSSTSVKFCTNFTFWPLYSRYLRMVSKTTMGLALPMCM